MTRLDECNPSQEFTGRQRETVLAYLNSSQAELLDVSSWTSSTTDLMLAAHTLLRFCVLDRIFDVMDIPPQPTLRVVTRTRNLQTTTKLNRVCLSTLSTAVIS